MDGPTILKMIMNIINPSTKVQLLSFQSTIESARLTLYNNDVNAMINAMEELEEAKAQIEDKGGSYDNFILRIFDSCLDASTSKNKEFKDVMQREMTDWQLGHNNVTIESATLATRTLFNNLKNTKLPGGGNKWDALDPREQKIMALATEIAKLRTTNAEVLRSGGPSDFGSSIPAWRTKYMTDRITHEGREYVWCNRHGRNGSSGLYMSFPHDHDAWLQQKRDRKAKQSTNDNNKTNADTAGGADDTSSSAKPPTGKLQLKVSLKRVLMTKKGLSGDKVEKIWAESVQK